MAFVRPLFVSLGACILPSDSIRELANDLQAKEIYGDYASAAGVEFNVPEKVNGPLSLLTGRAGFNMLLSRSLALAARDHPYLEKLKVDESGSLVFVEAHQALSPQERSEGGVALTCHLLTLLWTFLGETLTLRILQDVWPGVASPGLSSRQGIPP